MIRHNPLRTALMGLLLIALYAVSGNPTTASEAGAAAAAPSDETIDLLIFLISMAGLGVLSLWSWRRHQLRDRRAGRTNRSNSQTD